MATTKTVQAKLQAAGASTRAGYVRSAGRGIVVVDYPEELVERARAALQGAGYATAVAPNGNLLVAGEAKRGGR
jgi:hypothetical protein